MGNSDSKTKSGIQSSTPSSAELAKAYRAKVQARLEAEFDKRADFQLNALSRESFQSCLKKIQDEFDLYNISGSPLSIGLFESVTIMRPDGKPFMTKTEYASAMGLLFNNCEQSVLISATTQAILKWYEVIRSQGTVYTRLTDEILVGFFEASWKFAWAQMHTTKLSSNACLNGKGETDAIQRFADNHSKYFSAHSGNLKLYDPSSNPAAVDRTITVSVGDDIVHVPISFSHVSKPTVSRTKISYPQL